MSAIVLAGGRGVRFGGDKLRAEIDGQTILERAIAAVARIAVDVVVVTAPGDDRPMPAGVSIRTVHDRFVDGGPLVGLVAGLEAAAEPTVVLVAGDMPSLRPGVLDLLVATLLAADPGIAAIGLELRGRLEPLPAALRTGAATHAARSLVEDGVRKLRSLHERLGTQAIDEAAWRPLDPEAATLHDVDRPEDLLGAPRD